MTFTPHFSLIYIYIICFLQFFLNFDINVSITEGNMQVVAAH